MKRFFATVGGLVLFFALATTPVDAGAVHTRFTGSVGLLNPCNGETLAGTGPVKIVYLANQGDTHFVVHFSMRVKTAGSLGNRYVLSFVANGQFDAPSGTLGNVDFFDVPVHSEIISRGSAPNFDFDLGVRIFVVNGVATGALLIGPSTTTCHG